MKKKFIIISIFILSVGCKVSQLNTNSVNDKGIGEIQTDSDRAFSKSEMDIIKNVCRNLTSKRVYFDAIADSKMSFDFKLESKDCNGKVTNENKLETYLTKNLNGEFNFIANRNDYIPNVITDLSAGYKYLCDNMNAFNLNNYFIDNNVKYAFRVYINQGFDRIEFFKITKTNKRKLKYAK